jgi:hypothetical protein
VKDKADLLESFLGALYIDKDLQYCEVFAQVHHKNSCIVPTFYLSRKQCCGSESGFRYLFDPWIWGSG